MKTVLVALPVEDRHKKLLEAAAPECEVIYCGTRPDRELVQKASVIVGNIPADLIQASPALELLQLSSAGTDAYIVSGVLAKSTVLTNATGAYGKAVSEHAFAMALMLQKKLHLYRDAQNAHTWTDRGTVCSMGDATVLVVGLGDIGLRFARMCKAMGAHTIGVKRRPGDCPEGVDELWLTDKLDELLPRADVVASFLPGTGDTRGMYDGERFSRMKPGAVFINCGRGNAVNAEALAEALESGRLGAAGIDVTDPEPLPEDSPLWAIENLVITPHVSGFYHLPETFERIVEIAAENLGHWSRGETLRNIVDFKTGYKV